MTGESMRAARFFSAALAVCLCLGCSRDSAIDTSPVKPGSVATASTERQRSEASQAPEATPPGPATPARPETLHAAALPPGTPVAVVELFTSQGCSSCPPADSELARLVAHPPPRGRVFPLSFHVDYWNDLGWKDPWSNHTHSTRQRRYAQSLSEGRVYTPQMIVGGRVEFVGSNGQRLREAVAHALTTPSRVGIELDARKTDDRLLVWTKSIPALPRTRMQVALVIDTVENQVPRGENAGRELSHARVVRELKSSPVADGASEPIRFTKGAVGDRIVAFVQRNEDHAIIGANDLSLSNDAPR